MTVYGEVSEPLLNLLKTHSVGHTWFTFLQGLEPSAAIPPGMLVAARGGPACVSAMAASAAAPAAISWPAYELLPRPDSGILSP
jgi:hypothetical protein